MDGTLLKDRGIFVIAEKLGFYDQLIKLFKYDGNNFYEKSIEIAKLTKGYSKKEFLEIFREIPYQDHVEEIINELKKRNIITGIVTDSYQLLADDLKERLGIDYAFANNLIIKNNIITGELEIHNYDLKKDFCSERVYSICKSCVLEQLCNDLDITVNEAIAVGDGIVDIGMIRKAGLGIAFNASSPSVQKYADVVTDDLSTILKYI
jgi:HAD superfamily phosphoserine phosphatase-like hydrolase